MKIIDGKQFFSRKFVQGYGVLFMIMGFLFGFWTGFGLQ